MGRSDYKYCRQCGRPSLVVGELSHTRLCPDCGHENFDQSVLQQRARNGPIFQRWRRRIAASVGGVIPDSASQRT